MRGLKEIYGEKDFKRLAKPHFEIISSISEHVTLLQSNVDAMIEERKIANNMEDALESSKYLL